MDSLWTSSVDEDLKTLQTYEDEGVIIAASWNQMYCLDAGTGDINWEHETAEIGAVSGNQLFAYSDETIACWDLTNGEDLWRYGAEQEISEVVATDSIVAIRTYEFDTEIDEDHFVVLDAADGHVRYSEIGDFRRIYQSDDAIYLCARSQLGRYRDRDGYTALDTDSKWNPDSIVEDEDSIYFGLEDTASGVVAVDKLSGTIRFKSGGYTNDLILEDSTLYCAFGTGEESAAIDTGTGNKVWSVDDENQYGYEIAIDNDRVYIYTDTSFSSDDDNYIRAVTKRWGSEEWTWSHEDNMSIGATEGAVIVSTTDDIIGLDPSTGAINWRSSSLRRFTIANSQLFVTDGSSVKNIDPNTGSTDWSMPVYQYSIEDRLYSIADTEVSAHDIFNVKTEDEGSTQVFEASSEQNGNGSDTEVFNGEEESSSSNSNTEVFGSSEENNVPAFCPKCGSDLSMYDKPNFCPECGSDLLPQS